MIDEQRLLGLRLSRTEFLHAMRRQMKWVESCIADVDHDSWPPQLWVVAVDFKTRERRNVLSTLLCDFNEAAEKRNALRTIGAKLYAEQSVPIAAMLTAETWRALQTPGVEPRHHPDRRECITTFGQTLGEDVQAMASLDVVRVDDRIQPAKFGEINTGVKCPLLRHFFNGFFQEVVRGVARRN